MPSGKQESFTIVSGAAKILFKDGGLRDNILHGHVRVMAAAWVTAQSMAPEVETYMKNEAPWQDHTGNARNGLIARAFKEGDTVGIDLAHSVHYGIYLEAKNSGRFAIIQPTIDHMGPIVMRRFERLLDRY